MTKVKASDLQNIGHQLEMRDSLVISRSHVLQRTAYKMSQAIKFVFGLHTDKQFDRIYRAKKWINSCLHNYLQILKQLINIKKAREDFVRIQTDVQADKEMLTEKMKHTQLHLVELRNFYMQCKSKKEPTSTCYSDICLAISGYERCNDLYSLYNDILTLIDKTVVETERTEKLSNLCGVINSSSFFAEPMITNESFEETLFELLGYVAKCDRTKDYITSQLSIAKSANVDTALHTGIATENIQFRNAVEMFVEKGDFSHLDKKNRHDLPDTSFSPANCYTLEGKEKQKKTENVKQLDICIV